MIRNVLSKFGFVRAALAVAAAIPMLAGSGAFAQEPSPAANHGCPTAGSTATRRLGADPSHWRQVQLGHPTKSGRVTVAMHAARVINPKTLLSALRQAGLTIDQLRELL